MPKSVPTESGFTLLEILAVVALMASLVVVVMPQLTSFNKSQALQQASSQLQQSLRQAQNNAVSGVTCTDDTTQARGWYLRFRDATSYYIEPGNCPAPTPVPKYVSLPAGVSVSNIDVSGCAANNDSGVEFANVLGTVNFINLGGRAEPANAKMTITLRLSSDTLKVIIEKGGSVYVSST